MENGPLPDRAALRLGAPEYLIGWEPGGHIWQRVQSGALLTDGRAAIADVGSSQVVVLDPSGRIEAVLGRQGEGPGEFGYLSSVFDVGGDSILAVDTRVGRATLFSEMTIAREYQLDPAVFSAMSAISTDRNGGLIMSTSQWWPYVNEPWVVAVVGRYDLATGQIDTLTRYHLVPRGMEGRTPNPFRPRGWVAASSRSIVSTRGDRTQAERYALNGPLKQLIRWTEDRIPFDDSIWADYDDFSRSRQPPSDELDRVLARLRSAADGPLPYSTGLRTDDSGTVWVAQYAADWRYPPRYRVFSATGSFLGWAIMPPRFEILDFNGNFLLGVHRDELDVPAVALYRLQE
ncbi:MAG TPA: hypothetical protein VMM79_04725 [Longimicrobiales bacterium]|nr:hypothetical protein [Longimicrobiales bacterium]